MTAPRTLPDPQARRNPFDDIPDVVPLTRANPFDAIPDEDPVALRREQERQRHADILARNEAGREQDAQNAKGDTFRGQVVAGARDVYEAGRHPWETVKGLAEHAFADMGVVGDAMNYGMGQPSRLTPEEADEVPKALLNTAALALLPVAPEMSVVGRTTVNAGLGAINMPEQPIRGATAGLVIGEGLHRVGGRGAKKAAPRMRLNEISEPLRNADFANKLDAGVPEAVPGRTTVGKVKGYEPTATPDRPLKPNPRNPAGFTTEVNPFDEIPDVTPKKVAPVATEAPGAALERSAADQNFARELERVSTPDPEMVRGIAEDVRHEELTRQAALRALTGVRRRPGGVKPAGPAPDGPSLPLRGILPDDVNTRPAPASVSEGVAAPAASAPAEDGYAYRPKSEPWPGQPPGTLVPGQSLHAQGMEQVNAMVAKHVPKPPAPAPVEPPPPAPPSQPAARPTFQTGDDLPSYPPRPSEPVRAYPDGFAMGGPESRIPTYKVPRLPSGEPMPLPEGVTPETIAAAAAIKPNQFRGHTTEQLAHAAMETQAAIEEAQHNLALEGEASMRANESTGESVSDQSPVYANKGKTLQRALARMAKIEREFALRGLQGSELADVMQGARERRLEQVGADQDLRLGWQDDPFSDPPAEKPALPEIPADRGLVDAALAQPLPQGTPKPPGPLLNPKAFDASMQAGLAEAERGLEAKGVTKTKVGLAEQRTQARSFAHQMADDIGLNRLDLDPMKVGRLTGSEIVEMKEAAGAEMDKILALSKQLADPALPDAQRSGLSKMLEIATENRDRTLSAVVRASSQKGRDLNFLKQVAHRTLDPDVWMLQAKKALGDLPLTDDLVANLTKLVREAADACAGGA